MTDKRLFNNPEPDSSPILQSDFDELLELQSSILRVSAGSDDFADLTRQLCFMAEKLTPDSVASIMLYNKADERLYVHSAPSIPQEAIDALNGLKIGVGSCGNATYHDEATYVCNTMQDNRWSEVRDFAKAFQIVACWSEPVHNDANEVIGTFALSSFEVRQPNNFQRKLLQICASITGILLQKEKYIQQNAKWEKEILKSEKLESIGVLAGGIAHDFNNLLGVVVGNVEMATRVPDTNKKVNSYLTSAVKACKRATELTQQLLTFSKGGDPVKKLSDIRETIRESAEFVLHGSGVALLLDCRHGAGDTFFMADIDNGQISQVIQNIVINARQAMPDGGEIKITCSTTSDVSFAGHDEADSTRYHKIEIRDSGAGIPSNIIDNIFDPYFTTKSEGSGLGLALSFSIIKKHEGYIYVDTEVGVGTCFTIYLPASDQLPDVKPDNIVSINRVKAKGRVLVMDDQEMLHDVAEAMLEELGYQTVHAKDGTEAIQMYEQSLMANEPIDILIMDLTIPGGMGGKEAVKQVLAVDASAKVIVSSGYSNDSVMSKYQDYGFTGTLCKPYDIDELENTLNQVIVA